jgi:hypothetical protein
LQMVPNGTCGKLKLYLKPAEPSSKTVAGLWQR